MVRLGFAVVILVGSAILGVVVLRMHLLPWWCGALLIVAFPVGHFANALSPARRIFCWHCCGGRSVSPCWFARRHLSSRPWGSRHGLVDAGTARQPVRGRRQLRQTRPGTEEVYGIAVSRKGSQWTCSRTRRWFGTCSR
jgi:hypothetical protein